MISFNEMFSVHEPTDLTCQILIKSYLSIPIPGKVSGTKR